MKKMGTLCDTLRMVAAWGSLELASAIFTRGRRLRADRHLAVFAWALPPNTNAGVHRPLSFIRYGALAGWKIEAFHGETPANQREHGEELLRLVPKEVALIPVPKSAVEPAYRLTPQIDGGFVNALDAAKFAIARLESNPPDFVLASGPPFYVFVSAFYVARHFRVPLILDYRDEWTECPFDFVSAGPQDRGWERRCLLAADAVFFTTQSHIEHQLKTFPELTRDKTHLVPNGWVPEDFADAKIPVACDGQTAGKIRIAHVGNLAGHTPPRNFLNALEELFAAKPELRRKLQVSFIGRRSPEAEMALNDFAYQDSIEIVDHLPKREANRCMRDSDIQLLLSSPDLERYLPGKIFDYVAANKPILVYGSPGEASQLVEHLGVGLLCRAGSGLELGEALNKLVQLKCDPSAPLLQEWLATHRRDVLAKQAFEIIASVK
jgi:glycosyltransferase involved in cell wall biosynthesis